MAEEAAKSKNSETGVAKKSYDIFDSIFAFVNSILVFVGEIALMTMKTFAMMFRSGIDIRDLLKQMTELGADSIWIVLIITGATGAVFSLYTTTLALSIGFTQVVGGTMGYGFLNELGPLLAGVAFASRSGAAVAAEIGSMVVSEQVDALRAMAVSPIRYLVVPRVLASLIMLPLLTVLADIAGLAGGYLLAAAKGIPPEAFWLSFRTFVVTKDLTNGLIKSVVFGFLIGVVSCSEGLKTNGGATGVGRSTTKSVVLCVTIIFIADFFLAQILTGFK